MSRKSLERRSSNSDGSAYPYHRPDATGTVHLARIAGLLLALGLAGCNTQFWTNKSVPYYPGGEGQYITTNNVPIEIQP
jgi:hypothetical protein